MSDRNATIGLRATGGALVLAAALLAAGCATTRLADVPRGGLHHVVICWLKQPGDADARRRIIEASRDFASIPGVASVAAGPVLPSDRAIVDSSFDVAILLTFPDRETMDAYLKSPQHQKALKDVLQPLVSKILVYDFVD